MKKIEVKNFKLYTTAVISIEWKQELLNVNLDLSMMLKMMRLEGLTEANIDYYSRAGQPIPFKKGDTSPVPRRRQARTILHRRIVLRRRRPDGVLC